MDIPVLGTITPQGSAAPPSYWCCELPQPINTQPGVAWHRILVIWFKYLARISISYTLPQPQNKVQRCQDTKLNCRCRLVVVYWKEPPEPAGKHEGDALGKCTLRGWSKDGGWPGERNRREMCCLSGLGWSTASSLTPGGKAVPAEAVLTLLGRHAGKLQELLKAMSINHWLCEKS